MKSVLLTILMGFSTLLLQNPNNEFWCISKRENWTITIKRKSDNSALIFEHKFKLSCKRTTPFSLNDCDFNLYMDSWYRMTNVPKTNRPGRRSSNILMSKYLKDWDYRLECNQVQEFNKGYTFQYPCTWVGNNSLNQRFTVRSILTSGYVTEEGFELAPGKVGVRKVISHHFMCPSLVWTPNAP